MHGKHLVAPGLRESFEGPTDIRNNFSFLIEKRSQNNLGKMTSIQPSNGFRRMGRIYSRTTGGRKVPY